MYAVIKTGGKQYRVKSGDILKLEKLEVEVGKTIQFNQVMMITNGDQVTLGKPCIDNAQVEAEVLSQGRHAKIKVIKFRRRKHYRKQMGHRQYFTEVKIGAINHQ